MRTRLLPLLLLLGLWLPALAQDVAEEEAAVPALVQDASDESVVTASPAVQQVLANLSDAALRDEVDGTLADLRERLTAARLAAQELGGTDGTRAKLEATLADVEKELERYRDAYEAAVAGATPPSREEVTRELRLLREALLSDQTSSDELLPEREAQLLAAIELVRSERTALDERHRAWLQTALTGASEDEQSAFEAAWKPVRDRHDGLLRDLLDALSEARTAFGDCLTLTGRIAARRQDTISLLRRENLLLRGRSEITLDALSDGLRDIGALPGWATSTTGGLATALASGEHAGDVGRWAGATLLVMLLLILVRRRLRHFLRPAEELVSDVERSKQQLLRLLGSVLWAGVLAAPLLLAALLVEALPPGWGNVVRACGYTVAGFWIIRAFTNRLLPGPGRWSPIDLDARSAMLVRTGVVMILWLTAILLPFLIALTELGYANVGARQAVWTLYKLLVVVVLLLFVLRRGVLTGLLPAESTSLGRALRRIVGIVQPVLILVGPALLALDFLQYDVLAEFLLRLIGGVVVAAAAGFFAYGAIWKGLSAWIRSAVSDPPDATPETSRVEAALAIGRYVLLLLVLVGAVLLAAVVRGGNFGDVRDVLDVALPLQGQVEGKHITWFDVIAGTALLVLFLTAVPKVKMALERFLLPRTALDASLQYTISTLVGYIVASLGIYIALVQVFDLGALGYVFAALSVGIGFGLQEIVSNFVSGLILLFERPIKVGDLITVGTTEGWVTKINIRATTIRTRDNVTMLIPNKDFITQPVVNSVYDDTILRVRVSVGVAYGSDTQLVKELMLQAACEHPLILTSRRTEVAFRDFGGSALSFTLLCWIPEASEHMRVASDLRFKVDELFRENGVEIPFSQHDLHLRSIDDEAAAQLRGDPAGE